MVNIYDWTCTATLSRLFSDNTWSANKLLFENNSNNSIRHFIIDALEMCVLCIVYLGQHLVCYYIIYFMLPANSPFVEDFDVYEIHLIQILCKWITETINVFSNWYWHWITKRRSDRHTKSCIRLWKVH